MENLNSKIIKVNRINIYLILPSVILWRLTLEHYPQNYLLTEATGILAFVILFSVIFFFGYAATPAIPQDFKPIKVEIGLADWLVITGLSSLSISVTLGLIARLFN